MENTELEDVMVELDKVMPVLKISKTSAWKLAAGEWSKNGIAVKVGGLWRINWPRFLKHYGLNGQ